MKKNLTEIVFVLDRSGSMKPLEEDTIGGFNEFIEKQRKIEGEAYITTVLFDTSYQVLHEHVALDEVKPLTKDDYSARGGTALLDAVGRTIDNLGVRLSNTTSAGEILMAVYFPRRKYGRRFRSRKTRDMRLSCGEFHPQSQRRQKYVQ